MKSLISIASLLIICMAIGCSESKPGKLAKEAYLALKKIEAKTETGVTYLEYSKTVSDAKYAVNIFIESNENKNMPFRNSITMIMNQYSWVVQIWRDKIRSGGGAIAFGVPLESGLYKYLEKSHPNFLKDEKSSIWNDQCFIDSQKLTQLLWKDASLELNRISELFR